MRALQEELKTRKKLLTDVSREVEEVVDLTTDLRSLGGLD